MFELGRFKWNIHIAGQALKTWKVEENLRTDEIPGGLRTRFSTISLLARQHAKVDIQTSPSFD